MRAEARSVAWAAKIPDVEILFRKALMQLDFKLRVILHPFTKAISDQDNALSLLWNDALRHQVRSTD